MKKRICGLLLALLLSLTCVAPALAAGEAFTYAITVNGGASATVQVGETVQAALTLTCNTGDSFDLYTMQDYVKFDPAYFSLDESSITVYQDTGSGLPVKLFQATALDLGSGVNQIYVNRVSTSSVTLGKTVTVMTFDLKALKVGSTTLTHELTELSNSEGGQHSTVKKDASVTISNGSEGGGSGSTGSSSAAVTVPAVSDVGSAKLAVTVSGSTADVQVTDEQIKALASAVKDTGTVSVDASALNTDTAVLPVKLVSAAAAASGTEGLEILLRDGGVSFDPTSLESVGDNKLTVSAIKAAASDLSSQQKEVLGDQAESAVVVDVNVLVNGVRTSHFNGGVITVSIPYAPKAGEDTSKLVVWFVKDDGTLEPHAAAYDAKTGTVAFTTTHLSKFVLARFPFSDVSGSSYCYTAVAWAANNGITQGRTETLFDPNGTCTRAQTVTFLWRAMGSPEPVSKSCPFTDTDASAYYYKAVLWATEQGITKGTSDTTFSPNGTVTRAQVVTFQWRAAGSPSATTANPFTDVGSGLYYTDAVLWAVSGKITEGTTADTFSPAQSCTRAQIVTLLWRQLGK